MSHSGGGGYTLPKFLKDRLDVNYSLGLFQQNLQHQASKFYTPDMGFHAQYVHKSELTSKVSSKGHDYS